MSINKKGKLLPARTEEHKQKLREANLGENNPNYGKKPSEETTRKRSESLKKVWENRKMVLNYEFKGNIL